MQREVSITNLFKKSHLSRKIHKVRNKGLYSWSKTQHRFSPVIRTKQYGEGDFC